MAGRPSPIDQALALYRVHSTKLKENEKWCVVDAKWFRMFCAHTGFNASDDAGEEELVLNKLRNLRLNEQVPGSIDNSRLHEAGSEYELKRGIQEGDDYVLVNEEQWNLLKSWYGGGPEFKRDVVVLGLNRETRVELYPAFLCFVKLDATGEPMESSGKIRAVSTKSTLQNELSKICTESQRENNVQENVSHYRLWIKRNLLTQEEEKGDQKVEWVVVKKPYSDQLIEAFNFPPGTVLWLEKKQDDKWVRSSVKQDFRNFKVGDLVDCQDTMGKWYESEIKQVDLERRQVFVHYINWAPRWDRWLPFDAKEIERQGTHTNGPHDPNPGRVQSSSSAMDSYSGWNSSEKGAPVERGAVGLRNLGNTCFMNSTLQCLSNSPVLTDYFLSDKYVNEINRDNPLGWHGRIADAYGELLKELWSGKFRVVSPVKFKYVLGEFAPRFSGYQQQDSSELLSFLLDGLHEDLNQVKKKPPTNTVESNGRPDSVVALEAWETYQKRNMSVVVDTFQGQLKSRLVCPVCAKVSITFDPFMFLSVPLPDVQDKIQMITFVFDEDKSMLRCAPVVSKSWSILQLKNAISKLVNVPAARMVVTDVWSGKVCRYFVDDDFVSDIRANDTIFVYEVPELELWGPAKTFLTSVINFQQRDSRHRSDCFGLPLLLALPRAPEQPPTCEEVVAKVCKAAAPFAKEPMEKAFSIIETDASGRACANCDWTERCTGCALPSTAERFKVSANKILALDWLQDAASYRNEKLEIKQHESVGQNNLSHKEPTLHIRSCLEAFTSEEVLGENDPWFCSNCKEHRRANKKFDLWRLPKILIIHLKRFSYTRVWRDKINTFVDFPLQNLDLSEFCVNPAERAVYDLYAVSNHMGGMGGGHYNAYCKNLVNGNWYCHDDSSVSPTSEQSIKSSSAYVLFYVQRG